MPASAATAPPSASPALEAYQALAPFYDQFTAAYEYEAWLEALEALGRDHGLRGRRVLDLGCGTGKSFLPLLGRGYEVTACDLSPSMVELARAKAGDRARLFVADIRSLPPARPLDLVTVLDDGINYLLSDLDLERAFKGVARVLDAAGVLLFDLNSLACYRGSFATDFVVEAEGTVFRWFGSGSDPVRPGSTCVARIEIDVPGSGPSERGSSRHVQRHHPADRIKAALGEAGLELCAVRGQLPGGRLVPDPDEWCHTKVVYLARHERR